MHTLLVYAQLVYCNFVQYFTTKFKCPDGENSTCVSFDTRFENYFSVAAMVPIATMTAVNIWLQSKWVAVCSDHQCSYSVLCRLQYQYRMVISLIIMAVLFALTIAFAGVPTDSCECVTVHVWVCVWATDPCLRGGWILCSHTAHRCTDEWWVSVCVCVCVHGILTDNSSLSSGVCYISE